MKQCPTPSTRRGQVSRAAPRQKTPLAQTHLHQTETIMYYLTEMYWLVGRKSKLSTNNKLLIYNTILKPAWAYGIQLWGTASTSNIEILECFQAQVLRIIPDLPRYVPNTIIEKDPQIPTVQNEISRYSYQCIKLLSVHPNELILNLKEPPETRRLRRHLSIDLPIKFNM
jgi:hypothetical protein